MSAMMSQFLLLIAMLSFQAKAQFTVISPHTDAEKTADSSYYNADYNKAELADICSSDEVGNQKDTEFVCSGETDNQWMSILAAGSAAYSMMMPLMSMGGGGKFTTRVPKEKPGATTGTGAAPAEQPAGSSTTTTTTETTAPDGTIKKETTTTTDSKGAEKKEGKEKQDVCIYIPMVGEAAANAWNLIEQQKIEANLPNTENPTPTGTEQQEYIKGIQLSHLNNARTSDAKGYMWVGTAACYAAYFATCKVDAAGVLKLAAAGTLGAFYLYKAKKHRDYAEIAGKIYDKLPHLGACAPTSDPECYCSQPSTKYDAQYCLPLQAVGRVDASMNGIACVDSNMQVDPSCNCKAAGSCFGTAMTSGLTSMNLGSAYSGATKGAIDALSNGTYNASEAASLSQSGLAAARNALATYASEIPKELSNLSLTAQQATVAEDLVKAGVPRPLAMIAASFPKATNSQFASQNTGAFSNQDLRKAMSSSPTRYDSGGGNNKKLVTASAVGGPAAKVAPQGQVLQFADKAYKAAQINHNPDTNIFDIITKRYRLSADEKLK